MRIVVGSDGAIPSFGNFCVNEATGGAVFHAASSSLPSIVGGSVVRVAATCGGEEAIRSARMGVAMSMLIKADETIDSSSVDRDTTQREPCLKRERSVSIS